MNSSGQIQLAVRSAVLRCVLITGLLLLCGRAHAGTNLILNGDFEGTTYQYVAGTSTDTLPTDWTDSPPTAMSKLNVFASGSGPGVAFSGTHYIAFQSAESDGSQDCLNQVITTTPGQEYLLSFYVAMTANSESQFGMTVEWDAGGSKDATLGGGDFFDHPTAADTAAVPYTLFTFTETASSDSTSIYFHGADATGAILLDDVSVVQVPEPGVFGLVSASGLVLLALHRRTRRTSS